MSEQEVFSFAATKDGKVFIYWHEKHVMTLKGAQARKFLDKMALANQSEAQLAMAKLTGNFKRGNER